MRTLLKVTMDAASGNKAILDGSLQKLVMEMSEKLKPETAFFYSNEGNRTCNMIFDMKDTSDIPWIAEPFFMGMNAKVELYPVMNVQDLQKGIEKAMKAVKK